MEPTTRARILGNPVVRVIRWTVPWIGLVVVLCFMAGAWSSYQKNAQQQVAKPISFEETSPTADATGTVMPGAQAVTLIDGVSLRDTPSESGQPIARVGKGTKLEVLEKKGAWYRVKSPAGHLGWVTADSSMVSLIKK